MSNLHKLTFKEAGRKKIISALIGITASVVLMAGCGSSTASREDEEVSQSAEEENGQIQMTSENNPLKLVDLGICADSSDIDSDGLWQIGAEVENTSDQYIPVGAVFCIEWESGNSYNDSTYPYRVLIDIPPLAPLGSCYLGASINRVGSDAFPGYDHVKYSYLLSSNSYLTDDSEKAIRQNDITSQVLNTENGVVALKIANETGSDAANVRVNVAYKDSDGYIVCGDGKEITDLAADGSELVTFNIPKDVDLKTVAYSQYAYDEADYE